MFGMGFKMDSRFATVSKDEILAVNEAGAPTNTKKETKFGVSVFSGRYKKKVKIVKMHLTKSPKCL